MQLSHGNRTRSHEVLITCLGRTMHVHQKTIFQLSFSTKISNVVCAYNWLEFSSNLRDSPFLTFFPFQVIYQVEYRKLHTIKIRRSLAKIVTIENNKYIRCYPHIKNKYRSSTVEPSNPQRLDIFYQGYTFCWRNIVHSQCTTRT